METMHELNRKNKSVVIFKIEFEKAYDKVKWSFVQQTLRMKGFSPKWCEWIAFFIQGGHVGIRVNDQTGNNFQTYKGLRQGDPLSPILFNIVADMLALLIKRAKDIDSLNGVVPYLVDDGLSILQYADDTIIFLEHDLQQAKNLKMILSVFEKLFGLKINFHKSKLFCFGQAKEYYDQYSNIFGCKLSSFPIKYLGIPMHVRKLSNRDWKIIEQRIEKKLSSWKGKHLSIGGRLVLINSILSNLAMFMISFFRYRKGFFKKLIIIDHGSFGKGITIKKV
jgi:Reverse transcriptase (RNA-dependent DNA polymerase).